MDAGHFEQFKAGNDRALVAYFDRHARALMLFAHRMGVDANLAEELVQDAYLKLWLARERIDNEAHLKSFLYQATRNACIDHFRAAGSRMQAFTAVLDDNVRQPDADLLAQLIHAETLQLVYMEVKKLSLTQQQVFQLTFIDGLSTDEVCTRLEMTANAVFIARSRALSTLQRVFKGKDLLICLTFLQLAHLYRAAG